MNKISLAIGAAAILALGILWYVTGKEKADSQLRIAALEKELADVKLQLEAKPFATAANAEAPADAISQESLTSISFDKVEHDFGKLTAGESVRTKFKITNTGKQNLVISECKGSCGCTVPEWPKDPIAPGKTGVIDVQFDSHGKQGEQKKTVTVFTNSQPSQTILTIKSLVLPKP
jgi:hypothetical protein